MRWNKRVEAACDHFMDEYASVGLVVMMALVVLVITVGIVASVMSGGGPTCALGAHRAHVQSRETITVMVGTVATQQPTLVDRVVCVEDDR